jgi:hypothetical protein
VKNAVAAVRALGKTSAVASGVDIAIDVLLDQEALTDERASRRFDGFDESGSVAIPFLERRARIVGTLALGLRFREWQVRSAQPAKIRRSPPVCTHIPSRDRRRRHPDFDRPDARDVEPIAIGLRDVNWISRPE